MNNKVKIEIVVNNSKYFLKDLINSHINLYHIEVNDNKLLLVVDIDDYKIIKKKKTIKKLKIIEYYGINKLINITKHYKVLFLSIILSIALNILLSRLILNIEIVTPNNSLKEIVKSDLKELGISKGKWIKSFKEKTIIKDKILEKEKDKIEWLEISNEGTKYIIKVEERKKEDSKEECLPRNIISRKEAIVTRIESSDGEIKTQINEYVSPGTVLISGFIYNKEEVVAKKCAKGTVYGETWYKGVVSFPTKTKKLAKTNDYSWGLSFHIFNKEFDWPKKYAYYEKKEYNIVGSNFYRLGIYLIKEEKKEEKTIKYNLSSIDNIAINKVINELNKSFSDKPVIIRKNVLKKSIINSKIVVEVFIAMEEDITSYQDISQINIDEMNKKEE